jgi:hypothetical protein
MIFHTTSLPAIQTYLPESQQRILETTDHFIQYEKKLVTGETIEIRYFVAIRMRLKSTSRFCQARLTLAVRFVNGFLDEIMLSFIARNMTSKLFVSGI